MGDLTDDDLAEAEQLRSAIGNFVRHARRYDSMPLGQAAVLGYLDRDGAISIAELARRVDVKHQSMTRTVNLLRERRLVVLCADQADHRRVLVELNDEGRSALHTHRHRRANWIARATQTLSASDRITLSRVSALLDALAGADSE